MNNMNGVTEIDFNNVPTENRFSTLAPSLKNHGYRPPQQQQIYNECMAKHKYNTQIRYDIVSAIALHCQEIRNNTK